MLARRFQRSPKVEWVRRWQYELRWERGRAGVLSRTVDSLDELRVVVAWARQNPNVEKCSYRQVNELEGSRIEV